MRSTIALALCLATAEPASAATQCGGEAPCVVQGGNYRIELPDGAPHGVVVFFHGYQGSAERQMQARGLVAAATARGLAFAAVDGLHGTWSHPGAPAAERDETAFIGHVLDDLDARFGFGPDRVVLSGFSQGASMAWYAACALGDRVAGTITFAGVFWAPLPAATDCVTPPPMVHVHGTGDRTFPLEGRAVGVRWHQGDTHHSVATMRKAGRCAGTDISPVDPVAGIPCTAPATCARGTIALCLHPGGHEIRPEWLAAGLERLGF